MRIVHACLKDEFAFQEYQIKLIFRNSRVHYISSFSVEHFLGDVEFYCAKLYTKYILIVFVSYSGLESDNHRHRCGTPTKGKPKTLPEVFYCHVLCDDPFMVYNGPVLLHTQKKQNPKP